MVRVDLGTSKVDADVGLTPAYERYPQSALMDPAGRYAYFSTYGSSFPSNRVVKIDLTTFQAGGRRGTKRFVEELVARVRRAGALGPLTLRGDSAFWSLELIDTLVRLGVRWSITVPITQQIRAVVEAIDEDAWVPIDYPEGGEAQVAETTYVAGSGRGRRELRLVVRRSRLTDPTQLRLWPNWRHHAFVTDVELATVEVDQFHRDHATVELAIRDLKEGAGMEHCPSGRFFANAAWLGCAVLAHNLIRWTAQLGGVRPDGQLTVARTVRSRLLGVPGRLVDRAGRLLLRLPERWPWATTFLSAMTHLRALPAVPG